MLHGQVQYATRLDYTLDPRQLPAWYFGLGSRWVTTREVELQNGRERACDIDKHGFELTTIPQPAPHYDPQQAADELYPVVEDLLERRFGAKALVFDHVCRGAGSSKPVSLVHNDYSIDSGRPRIRALLADADPRVFEDRVAIVNVWIPLKPVRRDPLAFVDWTTAEPKDLIVAKLKYSDRTGETSLVYDNPKHQWVTFPHMQPGEAILLKVWDTIGAKFALHASPQTHSYFSKAPTRESIELRCMLLFHPHANTLITKPFVAPHIRRLQQGKNHFEILESKTFEDGDPHAW